MTDAVGRYRRALVLGGGSEIAHALVLELLKAGPLEVVLAARPGTAIDASPLEAAGATVERLDFDALATDTHEEALAPAFERGDVDLVVLAFGVLGDQAESERDPGAATLVAATNFTGAVSALTVVANRLRDQGRGTIAVLSTVAAQAPRGANWVYGASKAGLDAFVRGLQLGAADDGLHVLLVRPGFVRTKMTTGLKAAPFSVGPERVAAEVADALRRGRSIVWVPPVLRTLMWAIAASPPGFRRRF